MVLNLNKRMHCVKFGSQCMFANSYLSALGKLGALHLNKPESHSNKDALCKDDCNWFNGSGEGDFLKFVNIFSLFHNYLLLEKVVPLHLNKLKSPSPKDDLF